MAVQPKIAIKNRTMKLYIHEPVFLLFLFSSVPAIGTEFAFGKSDGLHQIVQTMETKGSEIQSLADLLHHLRVILAVGICIILKHLVTWVGSLSLLNDPSRDQIQL